MLSKSIINHPFFHADVGEKKAKEILKNSTQGNVLFCRSKNNSNFNPKFVLCYRASFGGQEEVHTLILNYNENLKTISHDSLGDAQTLYEVSNKLIYFLHGYADHSFNPIPIYHPRTIAYQQFYAGINRLALPPLVQDNVLSIYQKLDCNSLRQAMQVDKAWYNLIARNFTLFKMQYEASQLKKAERVEQVKYIFSSILSTLLSNQEGRGESNKCLSYRGLVLSEPQWYGSLTIFCYIHFQQVNLRALLINKKGTLSWFNNEKRVGDDFYKQLEELCRLGAMSDLNNNYNLS